MASFCSKTEKSASKMCTNLAVDVSKQIFFDLYCNSFHRTLLTQVYREKIFITVFIYCSFRWHLSFLLILGLIETKNECKIETKTIMHLSFQSLLARLERSEERV